MSPSEEVNTSKCVKNGIELARNCEFYGLCFDKAVILFIVCDFSIGSKILRKGIEKNNSLDHLLNLEHNFAYLKFVQHRAEHKNCVLI